jgi:hypothetical protein
MSKRGGTMSAQWILHKGKKILHISYIDLSPEKRLDQVREATRMIVESGSKECLSVSDLTGCFVDRAFIELAKQQSKISLPLTRKAAVVGVTGIKRILLDAVNAISPKARKPFDTVDLAKEWLVE